MSRQRRRPALLRSAAALSAVLLLAACESPEERAEGHYQEAVELIAAGDAARAKIELRNVFDLDSFHRDARDAYIEILLEEGATREAYGQSLRFVEQHPEDGPGRRRMALLAANNGDFDAAAAQAEAGLAILPDDIGLGAVQAAVDYRTALLDEDATAAAEAAARAAAILAEDPGLRPARLVQIDRMVRAERPEAALRLVEAGLAQDPEDGELLRQRIGLLAQTGDAERLGAELAAMAERFPDDEAVVQSYLRWLLSRGETAEVESFLRDRADSGGWTEQSTLLTYLRQTGGDAAMRAEIEAILAEPEVERRALLRAMRAEIDFAGGSAARAVDEMTALTEEIEADPGDLAVADRARVFLALARMQRETGDAVGARATLERALQIDPANAEGYKLRATWQIEADDPDGAVLTLRSALGNAPRDPEIMTLMANAHALNGDTALMGEMLARAVELSNSAPEEAARYARFLIGTERAAPAASIVAEARRLAPRDLDLLTIEGQLRLEEGAWLRLDETIRALEALGTEEARARASRLTAAALSAQERSEDLALFLDDLTEDSGAVGQMAQMQLLRRDVATGALDAALARADEMIAADEDDLSAQMARGAVLAAAERLDEAAAEIRDITRREPSFEPAWLSLYQIVLRGGDGEAAETVLREGLAAIPQSNDLNLMLAGLLERRGDLEGALAIHETLYERNRGSLVAANNLASLLSVTRTDAESLERAERIARRLRDSDNPAVQDTYGWIAYLNGDFDTALEYLERGAAGLPNDPRVRYHLARAQAATGDVAAATESFGVAMALAEARRAAGEGGDALLALIAEIEAAAQGQ